MLCNCYSNITTKWFNVTENFFITIFVFLVKTKITNTLPIQIYIHKMYSRVQETHINCTKIIVDRDIYIISPISLHNNNDNNKY